MKQKILIGVICALFTISYLTRTVYLVYEALFIEDRDCTCCKQLDNTLWFLTLLPLFDVFPCTVVLLFDTIRCLCGGEQGVRRRNSSLRKKSRVSSGEDETDYTADMMGADHGTEDFGSTNNDEWTTDQVE